jgi:hypothetical protein
MTWAIIPKLFAGATNYNERIFKLIWRSKIHNLWITWCPKSLHFIDFIFWFVLDNGPLTVTIEQ